MTLSYKDSSYFHTLGKGKFQPLNENFFCAVACAIRTGKYHLQKYQEDGEIIEGSIVVLFFFNIFYALVGAVSRRWQRLETAPMKTQ